MRQEERCFGARGGAGGGFLPPARDLDRAANARGSINARVDSHEAGSVGTEIMAGVYALETDMCPEVELPSLRRGEARLLIPPPLLRLSFIQHRSQLSQ